MFGLALGIVSSRKNTPKELALRGLRLLLLAYAFAFVRDFLSMYALYLKTGDAAYLEEGINCFLGVDILPFAGLVFLFLAAAAKLRFRS